MASLFEQLAVAKGLKKATTVGATPRAKLLYQADKMLDKLATYKDVKQLDYNDSNTDWWAGKASGNKRIVSMYYGSKIVADEKYEADNTIAGVKQAVQWFREIIEEVDDAWFDAEEERRAKESDKRSKK
jgi:hypothetical protein